MASSSTAIVLDGYVDEPTVLGVPPYVSTYVRYASGALTLKGYTVQYYTIDQWRQAESIKENVASAPLVVIICGLTVPGHYKGGTPISLTELRTIANQSKGVCIIGGPIQRGYTLLGGTVALPVQDFDLQNAIIAQGDIATFLWGNLDGPKGTNRHFAVKRSYELVSTLAVQGAHVVRQHPRFPNIICEIETGRGCERIRHCSFCTEPFSGPAVYRPVEHIVQEIRTLRQLGVKHIRLGNQPNIFAYFSTTDSSGRRRPRPERIRELFSAIAETCPDLLTLHIDNVNPGFVATYPQECFEIARTIARYNTQGDVAAFGMESADPEVIVRNNLKAWPWQVKMAIEIINQAAGFRAGNSLPKLLPGINFLCGLAGETAKTYELNYQFLKEIIESNLLIRRINIRRVIVFPGTPLYGNHKAGKSNFRRRNFVTWKRRVREGIERPMLQKVAPLGTVLKHVIPEYKEGGITFGRQLGSYPLLVGIPVNLELFKPLDVFVVGHGYRSVTALPVGLNLNSAPLKALEALPGIGKARAKRIVFNRPFVSWTQVSDALDDPSVLEPIRQFLKLDCN